MVTRPTWHGHYNEVILFTSCFRPTGHTLLPVITFLGGSCDQTILLPAQSVWSVHCLENGDFVVGSRFVHVVNTSLFINHIFSDYKARVFSADQTRQASAERLAVSTVIYHNICFHNCLPAIQHEILSTYLHMTALLESVSLV